MWWPPSELAPTPQVTLWNTDIGRAQGWVSTASPRPQVLSSPPLTSSDAECQQCQEQDQGPGPAHGSPLAQALGTAPVFPLSSQEVFMCEQAQEQLGSVLSATQPHFLLSVYLSW